MTQFMAKILVRQNNYIRKGMSIMDKYNNYENNSLSHNNEEEKVQYNISPQKDYYYSYQNQNPDSHNRNDDDLKTSSFYKESHKKPSKGRFKSIIAPIIIVALLSSLLTGGIVVSYFTYGFPEVLNNREKSGAPDLENTELKQVRIIDETTSAETVVAEKVSPSIVGIRVKYIYSNWIFGDTENVGSGSGIIYDSDGYILTNNHVIEGAMSSASKILPNASIEVILPNQVDTPYEAVVIGRDVETDLAVLKINASNLPAAQFGDSEKIKIGQKAIAIGNPAGLEFMGSVTSGVISGLNRQIEFDDGTTLRLIQTDAAINPGNSGGALLNSQGEVIGINTSKIGGVDFEGLGFAIPSNNAVEIADNLIQSGYVQGRPQIGIVVNRNFNSEIAEKNGVPEGILVDEVEPLSAAYMAGIQSGDIITKFNGVEIKTFEELETEKNKYKAGDKVEILLYRLPKEGLPSEGQYHTIELTLGERKG
jgi:serine protease Do